MRIGIVGAGPKGRILAAVWAADGHRVKIGTPDSGDRTKSDDLAPMVTYGSYSEAAAFGELVLLDMPWREALRELEQLHNELASKIIVDCVNPADEAGLPPAGLDRSFSETVAATLPESKVVKTLNTIVPETLEYVMKKRQPAVHGELLTILYCGNDREAKLTAAGLVGELDFEVIDAGDLDRARLLEPMGILIEQLQRNGKIGKHVAINIVHEEVDHSPLDAVLTD
jgi:predicted dinucleotide-binding enzyme